MAKSLHRLHHQNEAVMLAEAVGDLNLNGKNLKWAERFYTLVLSWDKENEEIYNKLILVLGL